MAKKEGRGTTKNVFFKDQEMNFTVLRALMGVYDDGATIGECLKVVQNTKNGDIENFIKEWKYLGDLYARSGDNSKQINDLKRTREYYLRASNYFKSAMITLNPLDLRHKEFWRLSLEYFEKAGALFDNPLEKVDVNYEGKVLPCYFIPASNNKKSPVLFLVTGGEGSNMEMYFWAGAYALKNGYSIFLYEGPGNFSTMYTSGLTMIPNSEAPIGKALDALCSRKDVDTEKIALLGISFGGYLVARAAAFDKRIKALIPDSPLRNIHRMLSNVFPKFIFNIPDWLFNLYKNNFMGYSDRGSIDLVIWEGGVKSLREGVEGLMDFNIEGIEDRITCPTLALAGEGEGADFYLQTNEFLNNINSVEKSLRIFKNIEGAGSHCQTDNPRLMNQEVIAWLNKIFKINPVM
jgi:pimeloyl-ACP methyl ester carboxylesterase